MAQLLDKVDTEKSGGEEPPDRNYSENDQTFFENVFGCSIVNYFASDKRRREEYDNKAIENLKALPFRDTSSLLKLFADNRGLGSYFQHNEGFLNGFFGSLPYLLNS